MMSASIIKKVIKSVILLTVLSVLITLFSCGDSSSDGYDHEAVPDSQSSPYLFDYENILIKNTSSIGIEVKNCNAYLDIYGELAFFGEAENTSDNIKTDLELTLDFLDREGNQIYSSKIPASVNYLRRKARYPFHYYFTEKEKYIDLCTIRTGVNYSEYNKSLEGNPIVEVENYFYEGDRMIIEGRVVNIGSSQIKSLRLLCTFYDGKDRVVFIKQCYLSRERMMPMEEQEFELILLMDRYLKEFTDFRFEVFFEDEIRVPA
jgi:hypothetical protein